jgi:hypothetical protein
LVNLHDLNFSIRQTESLNIQKQYKIVPIYLFLVTNYLSWDDWTQNILNFARFITIMIMLNWFHRQHRIWKYLAIWSSKIHSSELPNYLFWYKTKNVVLKLKFCSDIWRCFFNFVICIDYVKLNRIQKKNSLKNSITETFSTI